MPMKTKDSSLLEKYFPSKVTNEYLEKNTKDYFLGKNLIDEVYETLKEKNHSYRKSRIYLETKPRDESYSQIYELTENQLKIIYLTLENLKEKEFRKEIGKIIIDDINDKYSEHGGITTLNKNKIKFNLLKSELIRKKENDGSYLLPENINPEEYLTEFHLNASQIDETPFSGPSPQDLIVQEANLFFKEAVHEFVITSIGKGEFNIDYFGSEKNKGKSIVVDLGNYEY